MDRILPGSRDRVTIQGSGIENFISPTFYSGEQPVIMPGSLTLESSSLLDWVDVLRDGSADGNGDLDGSLGVVFGEVRDELDWVPEYSRRARGFTVYAALRSLGRHGIAGLIEGSCALARRMADRLAAAPGVEVLNDVVLNQVLVRFTPPAGGDADAFTREVVT